MASWKRDAGGWEAPGGTRTASARTAASPTASLGPLLPNDDAAAAAHRGGDAAGGGLLPPAVHSHQAPRWHSSHATAAEEERASGLDGRRATAPHRPPSPRTPADRSASAVDAWVSLLGVSPAQVAHVIGIVESQFGPVAAWDTPMRLLATASPRLLVARPSSGSLLTGVPQNEVYVRFVDRFHAERAVFLGAFVVGCFNLVVQVQWTSVALETLQSSPSRGMMPGAPSYVAAVLHGALQEIEREVIAGRFRTSTTIHDLWSRRRAGPGSFHIACLGSAPTPSGTWEVVCRLGQWAWWAMLCYVALQAGLYVVLGMSGVPDGEDEGGSSTSWEE